MTTIDPDDPRAPFRQVADVLRASILTGKLSPGSKLPSNAELTDQYGISKVTAQRAIEALKEAGLVVSRQGSGVFVRERTERPVGLRPHVERAFSAPQVTIDFAGFSGETLHGAISEPLDKIRDGRYRPDTIHVRMLVPDPSVPWTLPARVEDMADSPAFRKRAARIMERHTFAVVDEVRELAELGLISSASAEVRIHPAVPLFKLYIINKSETFFGYYPIEEHEIALNNEPTRMWDLMGKNATLFHTETGDATLKDTDTQFVQQSQVWFDSLWNIAREVQP
ncbi:MULTISPECIES: GntR family transcriptional regulator [unclassified Nocardia]|uniref:GntR family transcriptional regulator n=1 Tax=unclassified Nocardia TaxID=2637762 RepID=UPI001CE415E6|nr:MULTISPECIES: GntR family transcriptional regulator [unclassified Nocardia]